MRLREGFVTIAIIRNREADGIFLQALQSLSQQQKVHASVLVIDQSPHDSIQKWCAEHSFGNVLFIYHPVSLMTIPQARNYALNINTSQFLLFFDADEIADERWAYYLVDALHRYNAAIVGGPYKIKWLARPPFFVKSTFILSQYSWFDLGREIKKVHRVNGGNWGMNLFQFRPFLYFDEGFSRAEDSRFCDEALHRGLSIYYVGNAVVYHQIDKNRLTYAFLIKKIFLNGFVKAQLGGIPRMRGHKKNIWDFICIPLCAPIYIAGYCKGLFFTK